MRIVLYSRRGCHLCERAEDLLACHWPGCETVDVDTSPELTARYGLRVPVLEIGGEVAAEGVFDEPALVARLMAIRSGITGP